MSNCITESDLFAYHAGELSDDHLEVVRKHLECCSECRRRDHALVADHDSLLSKLRGLDLSETISSDGAQPSPVETLTRNRARSKSRAAIRPANIQGYDILGEIHRGGQGVVYKAFQRSTKRKVAIKVLLGGAFASPSSKRRFEREIELIASLEHPHIVAVHDSGTTGDGQPYYVMDYIEGRRLDEYARATQLNLEGMIRLFGQICDAISFAHQKGVIHRDLKPSNILVDAKGAPRIVDFGLAKNLGGPVDALVSVTGQVVGTLPYMSPEQAQGLVKEVDTRTDVYALGVIFYELLTGQYPYTVVGQMADVLKNIVEMPVSPPTARWTPDSGVAGTSSGFRSGKCPIDDEVQPIVLKCLAKEPQRRYQSAAGLLRDIERYVKHEPIEAKRDNSWYVLRKLLRRHAIASTALAAVLITIVSFGSISFQLYRDTRKALQEKQISDNQAIQRAQERDTAINASTQPVIRSMALGWFLSAWRVDQLEWAQGIQKRMPADSPEGVGMTFLLDEEYSVDKFIADLTPNASRLAYFLVGERYRKADRATEAIAALQQCLSEPGDAWLASAAQASL